MAWKQLVTPDLDPYVYVNGAVLNDWYGWCLATVECAYDSPRLYPNAWAGWLDAKAKHEDRDFPVGVYFPIWFSGYGGLGHVAIAYLNDNGSLGIWTSPFTHIPYFYTGYTSIDALASGYGVDYVGWSEDIAGMSVVQWFDDTPPPVQVPTPEPISAPPTPTPVIEPPAPTPTPEPAPNSAPTVTVTAPDPAPPPTTTVTVSGVKPPSKVNPLTVVAAVITAIIIALIAIIR